MVKKGKRETKTVWHGTNYLVYQLDHNFNCFSLLLVSSVSLPMQFPVRLYGAHTIYIGDKVYLALLLVSSKPIQFLFSERKPCSSLL